MPTYLYLFPGLVFAFCSCINDAKSFESSNTGVPDTEAAKNIRGISLPKGYQNVETAGSTYASWLLDIRLKEDNTVYLHNGGLKSNQFAQFGVLDINIGKKDLIQCADAAIKLRADFLFEHKLYSSIKFKGTSGDEISFAAWLKGTRWKERSGKLVAFTVHKNNRHIRDEYKSFMEIVFAYCGTYSLSKQLKPVLKIDSIKAGDVFVEGGFPGHAVTVMAVARNSKGNNIFLLAQGYMPAQDIHILKNYVDPQLSPWYSVKDVFPLYTPEWQFGSGSLKRWE